MKIRTLRVQRGITRAILAAVAACGGSTQVSSPANGTTPAPRSVSITDGESVIRAMNAKYAGRWPKTGTYIQSVELLGAAAARGSDQTWYDAVSLPGRLRIDYVNPDLGNGLLYNGDSSFQFANGHMVRSGSGWNDLLLMTQDVYLQPPELTASILRGMGVQVSKIHTSSFLEKSVYVIGAGANQDSASKQFWIERDRLVLVRVREKRADGQFTDIHLGQFIPFGQGLIAREVYQMLNSQPRVHQHVSNVTADPVLDPALFDPAKFATVKHWSK
jgi:hypothetical protein